VFAEAVSMDVITNLEFIRVVFGNAPDGAVPWVAGFKEDPYKAGRAWHGGAVANGKLPGFIRADTNNFIAISGLWELPCKRKCSSTLYSMFSIS
jgi:hypothetical protein